MSVARVNAVPNAPMAVAKQMAPEAIRAGFRPGRMTSLTTSQGDDPERAGPLPPAPGLSFSAAAMMVSNHPGNREVDIAHEQSRHGVGEHELVPGERLGDVSDEPCRPASMMTMNPTTTPGTPAGT